MVRLVSGSSRLNTTDQPELSQGNPLRKQLLLKERQWLSAEKLIDNAVLVYKMKTGITPDHCIGNYSFQEITHPYDTRATHSKFSQLNRYNSSYMGKTFFICRSKGLEQTSGAGERCALRPYF